jgi:hypothetical protein
MNRTVGFFTILTLSTVGAITIAKTVVKWHDVYKQATSPKTPPATV